MTGDADEGRQAFTERRWAEARERLGRVVGPTAGDLEQLAIAAHLVGHDDASARAWEQAQREHSRHDDQAGAARCAFWLGFSLLLRGKGPTAAGWLARAERLEAEAGGTSATSGLVLLPEFLDLLWSGQPRRARGLAQRMAAIARRCGDDDLLAFSLLCRGEALLALGKHGPGTKALDDAMVSVATGEVSPMTAGILYCAVIEACVDAFDLQRAGAWTEALDGWCSEQPDLVPYRGVCLVHRAQVLQARGAWSEAAVEAERARRRLAEAAHPAIGAAHYQQGELHRVRGAFGEARQAYERAREHGREPVPGLALLLVAEGKVEAAVAVARRMVEETRGLPTHPAALAAAVEVHLATDDVDAAREAATSLADLVGRDAPPMLQATLELATGSVQLAAGDALAALSALRRACAGFVSAGMPYDVARVRIHLAHARHGLGDDDGASFEVDAARATFARLGARPALARLDALDRSSRRHLPGGLTDREHEVLRVVATGVTNREVASALGISEHTVARHLQNIFAKLGLTSRSAATAYAHEHHLV